MRFARKFRDITFPDALKVSDYVQELIGFPNAEHDDQVDATTQALNR